MNIKNTYKASLSLATMVMLAISCSSPKQERATTESVIAEQPEITKADLAEADAMIKNMPSPIEMAILVKHAGGEYNPDLLNDVKNLDKYVTTGKKTINMGVYSADVGYTSLYKQTQETIFYLNNVRKLSDAIGLSVAFDQSMFDRVEANIENRDSLLQILSVSYDMANQYLKENDRMNTSILMLAGGWVESMYLAGNLGANGGRPEAIISLRILEQEAVLKKLVKAMYMIDDDPLVAELAAKLETLSEVLVAKEIQIGIGEQATVDTQKMEEVYQLVDEIRAWIVA